MHGEQRATDVGVRTAGPPMHEYAFKPEVVRVALVVGVIVSIVFYERVQLTTGGAIVPAYLAMFLPAPIHIVTTIGAAQLSPSMRQLASQPSPGVVLPSSHSSALSSSPSPQLMVQLASA